MTECERIIKEGILPASFFEPETICDFYVDEKRKKIWAVSLDLLIKFDSVCKKHNLRYFLSFGTLLGAIRHKGFIPWDDDIDVCMLRKDYEKLKELKSEFEDPYFLQFPGCDKDYFWSIARLKNSNTSGISSVFRYAKHNQGEMLDIFPLDNCNMMTLEDNAGKISDLIAENSAWMRMGNPYLLDYEKKRLASYKGRNPEEVFEEIDAISRQYEKEETEYVTCAEFVRYNPLRMTYKRTDLEQLVTVNLYGYEFPIPENYDTVLRTTYNDYMQFPSVEKRGTWHDGAFFNPDVPYLTAISIMREYDLIMHRFDK